MIRQLITANPAATDAEILALIPIATQRPILRSVLASWAMSSGLLRRLRMAVANAGLTATQRADAQDAIDILTQGPETIRTDLAGDFSLGILAKALTGPEKVAAAALGGGMLSDGHTTATIAAERAAMDAEASAAARRAAFDAIDNGWGIEIYGVGRAELLRRHDAGEPVPTVDDLLAFVVAGRQA